MEENLSDHDHKIIILDEEVAPGIQAMVAVLVMVICILIVTPQ